MLGAEMLTDVERNAIDEWREHRNREALNNRRLVAVLLLAIAGLLVDAGISRFQAQTPQSSTITVVDDGM